MPFQDELNKIEQGQIAELFEITVGNSNYYYTSFEAPVVFQAQEYTPKPISRGQFNKSSALTPTRVKLTMPFTDPVKSAVSNTPIENTLIKIYRVCVSDTTMYAQIFSGEVINISFPSKGMAEVDCETSSIVFRNKLPIIVHQPFCNHRLYDTNCQVNPELFKVSGVVTAINQSQITSVAFGSKPNGYFLYGRLKTSYGDHRPITNHSGNVVTVQMPFDARLIVGATVEALAGCNKSASTCNTKFNNFPNFAGFPFIPSHNPVVWGL